MQSGCQVGHSTGNCPEGLGAGPLHAELVGGVVLCAGGELHGVEVVGGGVVICFDEVVGGVVICFDVLGGGVVDGGALGFGTFDPGGGTLPVPP